jgi:adenosylmethionine-8-amino-7-oxononanoate aminotransferase
MMIPYFQERGIMIRPLGNIIYFLPPYCVSKEDLDYLYATTLEFISFFVEKQ